MKGTSKDQVTLNHSSAMARVTGFSVAMVRVMEQLRSRICIATILLPDGTHRREAPERISLGCVPAELQHSDHFGATQREGPKVEGRK